MVTDANGISVWMKAAPKLADMGNAIRLLVCHNANVYISIDQDKWN